VSQAQTPARRRRLALVVAASIAVHGLILALIGSHAPRSIWRMSNLDQAAVQVELARRPAERRSEPPKAQRPRRTSQTAQAAKAPARPIASPHLPAVAPPVGAPAPWTVAPPSPLPPGFLSSLQAHVGCPEGDMARMSRSQREACARQFADGAASAPFIPAPMAPEKRAAFDRAVRCRADYDNAPVPPGTQGWGLGYVPRLRDCGPKDH
jgi:hypothetical protein